MRRGLTKEEPLSRIRYLLREVIGFSGLTAWRGLRADGRAAGCRRRAAMTHSAQEFPVRCGQIPCSKVEQGILCKALMSHREKAAPSSKQPPIGRKISQFPVKFAVLRESAPAHRTDDFPDHRSNLSSVIGRSRTRLPVA